MGLSCRYRDGRTACRTLLIAAACLFPAHAQWRHFGETTSATPARRQILDAHNSLRSSLGLPPLQWSDELTRSASQWADVLVRENTFRHDGSRLHGQNLFEITNGRATPRQVVDAWGSEAAQYHRRTNSCSGHCGHYTQMVWRSTTAVGCASAGDSKREVWVCDYSPPGNIAGMRPY